MDGVDIEIVPQSIWSQDNYIISADIFFLVGLSVTTIGGVLAIVAHFDWLVEFLVEAVNQFNVLLSKNPVQTVPDVVEAQIASVWMDSSNG